MGGDAWILDGRLVESNAEPGPYEVNEIEYTILKEKPPHVRGGRFLWDRTGAQWIVLWIITDSGNKQPFAWPSSPQAQKVADAIDGGMDGAATRAA